MKKKLNINEKNDGDIKLIKELLDIMHVYKLDYTNTFIDIQNHNIDKYEFMKNWMIKFNERKTLNNKLEKKNNINPYIIPRNHIIDKILNESDNNKFNKLEEIMSVLQDPYSPNKPKEYTRPPNENEKVHQTFCGT